MKTIAHFIRTHLGAFITAVTVAVVLGGGILTILMVGDGGPAAVSAAPTTTSTTGTTLAPSATVRRQALRGTVAAISATTWTVATAQGRSVTVDITPQTVFGSKAAPLAAANFSVGEPVAVIGTRTQGNMTATRITKARPGANSATTTTPTT